MSKVIQLPVYFRNALRHFQIDRLSRMNAIPMKNVESLKINSNLVSTIVNAKVVMTLPLKDLDLAFILCSQRFVVV